MKINGTELLTFIIHANLTGSLYNKYLV